MFSTLFIVLLPGRTLTLVLGFTALPPISDEFPAAPPLLFVLRSPPPPLLLPLSQGCFSSEDGAAAPPGADWEESGGFDLEDDDPSGGDHALA